MDIKDRETEALLDEIRTAIGKEVDDILRDLARQEAERVRKERDIEERRRRINEITARTAARIPEDAPSPDEIVGYDERGLPTTGWRGRRASRRCSRATTSPARTRARPELARPEVLRRLPEQDLPRLLVDRRVAGPVALARLVGPDRPGRALTASNQRFRPGNSFRSCPCRS
jgi:hypothetical protein